MFIRFFSQLAQDIPPRGFLERSASSSLGFSGLY